MIEDKEQIDILKEFYDIDPVAPYYTTGVTLLDEVAGGGLGFGYPGGKVINIASPPSAGKCIRDAYVLTDKGFVYIDDMGAGFEYGATPYDVQLGLNNEKSVKANFFYKEKVHNTVKVTTKNYFKLEGTPDHPIAIWTNCGIVMKKLSEVCKGDYVCSVGGTHVYGDYQHMPQISKDTMGTNTTVDLNIPAIIDEDFAYMLGCFVADGNFALNYIALSNTRDWFVEHMINYFSSLGLHAFKRDSGIAVASKYFTAIMKAIFENPQKFTARHKFVPRAIMQSPRTVQAKFLQGLIDCDGYENMHGNNIKGIEYSTASEKLMNEVRLLLLNMGIHAAVYAKHGARAGDKFYDHTYYRVFIDSANLKQYDEMIGSRKFNLNGTLCTDRNSQSRKVPYIGKIIHMCMKEIGEKAGVSQSKLDYEHDTYLTLTRFIRDYREYAQYFPEGYPLDFFTAIMDRGYNFNEVTDIEVRTEEVDVYDFHVPDGHLFWSNGFISHNTFLAWHTLVANTHFWEQRGVKFKFMYDDAEFGSTMDLDAIYGLTISEDNITHSESVEQFHASANRFLNSLEPGERGIYVLDSLDPLKTENDLKLVGDDLAKIEDGKKADRGSFDMAKQKYLSARFFPQISQMLHKTQAVIIVISQVRYNVNGMGPQYTVGGGMAIEHLYNTRIMLTKQKTYSITRDGEEIDIGVGVKAKLMKNKCPRPGRTCSFDIYFSRGIDDVGACIDYLYGLKTDTGLTKKTMSIEWDEQTFKNKEQFTKFIYENGLYRELRARTIAKWERIEDAGVEAAESKIPERTWEW